MLDGMPFDAVSLRRRRRVEWAHYCVFIERMEERVGGPEALERLLLDEYHRVSPELRWLAGVLVSPKAFASVMMDKLVPMLFPPIAITFEDRGPNRIYVEARLRPGARPCLTFFRGNVATIGGMPQNLGLPPAKVVARISDVSGLYECEFAPSRTLAAAAERSVRTMVHRLLGQMVLQASPDSTGSPLVSGSPVGAATDVAERLGRAVEAWDLTARQIEVLELLAQGEANKEIAQALDCAENTVELHVTRLLRKSGAPTRAKLIARFWSEL
jgi:DNA-binding CsgD family transcriptional regulator